MALPDVTLLDLSHALAGPFASTMLADFGASVIKVEPPGTGDISRAWGPPFYGSEPAYFVNLNRTPSRVACARSACRSASPRRPAPSGRRRRCWVSTRTTCCARRWGWTTRRSTGCVAPAPSAVAAHERRRRVRCARSGA